MNIENRRKSRLTKDISEDGKLHGIIQNIIIATIFNHAPLNNKSWTPATINFEFFGKILMQYN